MSRRPQWVDHDTEDQGKLSRVCSKILCSGSGTSMDNRVFFSILGKRSSMAPDGRSSSIRRAKRKSTSYTLPPVRLYRCRLPCAPGNPLRWYSNTQVPDGFRPGKAHWNDVPSAEVTTPTSFEQVYSLVPGTSTDIRLLMWYENHEGKSAQRPERPEAIRYRSARNMKHTRPGDR